MPENLDNDQLVALYDALRRQASQLDREIAAIRARGAAQEDKP